MFLMCLKISKYRRILFQMKKWYTCVFLSFLEFPMCIDVFCCWSVLYLFSHLTSKYNCALLLRRNIGFYIFYLIKFSKNSLYKWILQHAIPVYNSTAIWCECRIIIYPLFLEWIQWRLWLGWVVKKEATRP